MFDWVKKKKWVILCVLLIAFLLPLSGIHVADKSDTPDYSVKIGIGNEKVVTLGHVAYAAGSVDYTYDGTDDNVQFQAALDALPATGGRLVDVSAVQKNFSVTVTRAIPDVIVEGSGFGSYFTNDGGTALFTAGGNGWKFSNLRTDAGGINMGATAGWTWVNVNDGSGTVYDVRTPAGSIVNGAFTASSITDSGLTSGRVPIAGAGGLLGDDSNLTFDTVTGTLQVSGANVTRTATYVVAASDSPAHVKAQADFVCDGTADDEDIQAAIDSLSTTGGKIKLSNGTFNIAVPIVFAASWINLDGEGWGTVLKPITNLNDNVIEADTAAPRYGIIFSNFRIDGNKANQSASGTGINFSGFTESEIRSLRIIDTKTYCINADASTAACDNNKVSDSILANCDGSGLRVAGCYGWDISHNPIIYGNGSHGVVLSGGGEHIITGTNPNANTDRGFYIYGATRVEISNYMSCYNGSAGVDIASSSSYIKLSNGTVYDNGFDNAKPYGIALSETSNHIKIAHHFITDFGSGDQDYGVILGVNTSDVELINNDLTGNVVGALTGTVVASDYIRGNIGYIAQGEIRSASGSLTGGAANSILFAWHNPEARDIFIRKVIINITTLDANAANIDCGIADDATYTNGGTEFFDDLAGETAQLNDSWVAGDGGTQTKWVLCQDSASATDGWVVAKILDNDGSSIVGSYYIEYVGR